MSNYSFDLSYIECISSDPSFIKGMVSTFVEEIPLNLEQLKSYYKKGDLESMGDIAHKVKPTIIMLNMDQIKPIIVKFEELCRNNGDKKEIGLLLEEIERGCMSVVDQLKAKYED